jgi:hypothetical protein
MEVEQEHKNFSESNEISLKNKITYICEKFNKGVITGYGQKMIIAICKAEEGDIGYTLHKLSLKIPNEELTLSYLLQNIISPTVSPYK